MKSKKKCKGELNLIIGCMWSGKTSELLTRYERYTIGNRKCLLIRYKKDDRYDKTQIITHNKRFKINAYLYTHLYAVDQLVHKYDVICVDEIQFFKDAHIFCQKWANMGKIVEVCGLNGKFDLSDWIVINKLIPLIDDITFIKAVCKETGADAIYTTAIDTDMVLKKTKDGIAIGGGDMYRAVDRETYYKYNNMMNYHKKTFGEFIDIYINEEKIESINKTDLLKYFEINYKEGMPYISIIQEYIDFDKSNNEPKTYMECYEQCAEGFEQTE